MVLDSGKDIKEKKLDAGEEGSEMGVILRRMMQFHTGTQK